MALQYSQPAAPGCAAATLPTIVAHDCADDVNLELSEIVAVYIALPLIADPTQWDAGVSFANLAAIEASKTSGKLLYLPGIGSLPAPERPEVNIHRGMKKRLAGRYSLAFKFMDLDIVNYEALRVWQHGVTVRFVFETLGGFLYGAGAGDYGIYASLNLDFDYPEGTESYATANIKLDWFAKTNPKKIVSPYALVV